MMRRMHSIHYTIGSVQRSLDQASSGASASLPAAKKGRGSGKRDWRVVAQSSLFSALRRSNDKRLDRSMALNLTSTADSIDRIDPSSLSCGWKERQLLASSATCPNRRRVSLSDERSAAVPIRTHTLTDHDNQHTNTQGFDARPPPKKKGKG